MDVRREGFRPLIRATFRSLGWFTAIASIVIQAFIISRWPEKGAATAAGIIGATIAVLNDSWEVVAIIYRDWFAPMPPTRLLTVDMLSLAVCLGGIILLLFSSEGLNALSGDFDNDGDVDEADQDAYSRQFPQHKMFKAALWSLVATV